MVLAEHDRSYMTHMTGGDPGSRASLHIHPSLYPVVDIHHGSVLGEIVVQVQWLQYYQQLGVFLSLFSLSPRWLPTLVPVFLLPGSRHPQHPRVLLSGVSLVVPICCILFYSSSPHDLGDSSS